MMPANFTTHSRVVGANLSSVHCLRSGAFDVSNTSFATLVATSSLLASPIFTSPSTECRRAACNIMRQATIGFIQHLS